MLIPRVRVQTAYPWFTVFRRTGQMAIHGFATGPSLSSCLRREFIRMDVKSGYPWWPIRNGLVRDYPPLRADITCDVAIIGAGITGALIADALVDAGLDTVVLDKRDVAWGSTAASTALLQYEIDTELAELGRAIGMRDALRAYRACEHAMDDLARIAETLKGDGYTACRSLYLALVRRHLPRLRAEYTERVRHGFDVEWLESASLQEKFGVRAFGALLSRPAGRVDPYRLAHALLARASAGGARVHDHTAVSGIEYLPKHVRLHCARNHCVRARWLVLAAGYESEGFLPEKVARNRSSYAFVSEPVQPCPAAFAGVIAWETRRPYLYWRATEDDRVIVGGEDDATDLPARRDGRVVGKAGKLLKRITEAVPGLELEIAYAWGGTFAETRDGLPCFGPHPACDPRVLFAMAYGGNGITYSMIGAGILRATIRGERHLLSDLFGFARASR
jgi:glycine/D-amino acid oxidase-like deaminating enzyme